MAENIATPAVGMVARLVTARGEELCLLRHLSLRAATIQVYSALATGEPVRLDLTDGTSLPATVSSRHDSLATLEVRPGSSSAAAERRGELRARLPRLDVGLPVQLRMRGAQAPGTLCNISQGGAKIRAADLAIGMKLSLLVGGLPPLAGRIRWMRDDGAGMSFYDHIPLEIIAPWSAALGARVDAAGKVLPGDVQNL